MWLDHVMRAAREGGIIYTIFRIFKHPDLRQDYLQFKKTKDPRNLRNVLFQTLRIAMSCRFIKKGAPYRGMYQQTASHNILVAQCKDREYGVLL